MTATEFNDAGIAAAEITVRGPGGEQRHLTTDPTGGFTVRLPVEGAYLNYTLRTPSGVVANCTPFNHPLMIMCKSLAAVLASGCTTVVKPSEYTPLTTLKLAQNFSEAGLPKGVFNIVLGYGAILLTHAHIDHLGTAIWFAREHGTPVYCHADEVGHAKREYLEQVSILDLALRIWRPTWALWTAHVVRSGGLIRNGIPATKALTPDIAAGLPGRPLPVSSAAMCGSLIRIPRR